MDYQELSKIFYMSAAPNRYALIEEEAQQRRSMPSSIDVGIDTPSGRLFVAMPQELIALQEHVLKTERSVAIAADALPRFARSALTRSLVLDEVVSTNAIEAIQSTRKQVQDSLKATPSSDAPARRFRELARLYLAIGTAGERLPRSVEDIRAIYDKVTEGEIPENERPDGKLFRASGVEITAGNARVVHTGLEPESKIIAAIEGMLALVENPDHSKMVAAIASHYVFEYIHPFYDGNGRTGRYLLSLFLSKVLSLATVLSLSRAIHENLPLYYGAFKSAENPLNKGELTFFVRDLLHLVAEAQGRVTADMEASRHALGSATHALDQLAATLGLPSKEQGILLALAQCELFGMVGSMNLDELAESIGVGKQMARRYASRLESRELITLASKRPLQFELSDEARRALGIDAQNLA